MKIKKLEIETRDSVLYCKECQGKVQAGERWVLFCPTCKSVEDSISENDTAISSVMSCTHCDQPLTIKTTEDEEVIGRCHTETCGDCYSMQDLCLVTLKKPIIIRDKEDKKERLSEHSSTSTRLELISSTTWAEPISRGRRVPRRPSLDDYDAM